MAFMLGSFTSGLFNGARDAFQLVNDWHTLKNQSDMRDAAGAVRDAMGTATGQQGALPSISTSASAPSLSSNRRPDFGSVPPPDFMKTLSPIDTAIPRPQRKPPLPDQAASALPASRTTAPSYLPPAGGAGATYTPLSRPPMMTPQPQSALPLIVGGGGTPGQTAPAQSVPVDQGGAAASAPISPDQGASAAIPPAPTMANPTGTLGQQIMRALGSYQPM